MPYWWGIMRRKQISMAATCTLLVVLKNLTECLSLPSSLSYLNTEVDEVSTLLSLLYATFWFFFFFSRPILFLFSRFREGNVIKKICIGEKKLDSHEQNLLIFRGVCCLKKKNTCQGITQKHFKSWRFHFTWWFSRSFSIKYSVCTCQGELTNFNKTLLFCSIL